MSQGPDCGKQDDAPRGAIAHAWRARLGPLAIMLGILAGLIGIEYGRGNLAGEALGEAWMVWAFVLVIMVVGRAARVIKGYHEARCGDQEGRDTCWSGVVNDVERSFSSGWHYLFPFAANHGYADIVVKSDHWPTVIGGAYWIHCAKPGRPRSYLLRTHFYDDAVCKVGELLTNRHVTTLVQATAITAGVVVGAMAAAAAATALGCATVVLCPLALLVFAIVAAVVAVLALLLLVGLLGNAARAIFRSDDAQPSAATGSELRQGDLVTVAGEVVTHLDHRGANLGWFADPRRTMVHGRADGQPPYDHEEADALLPSDGCAALTP